ncbi:unnamed protein product [Lupinus luteus]|uniref:Uncharacterized protein n=1 Tax=Lupinus luteus TaxID=3873 RepID=A0AAV1VUQ9_LUPLU
MDPSPMSSSFDSKHPNQSKVIANMIIPKSLTLFILLVALISGMKGGSASRLMRHVDMEKKPETKYSSMFTQTYSALLSSLNTNKDKSNQFHAISHRLVPSGPNPLHN